MSSSSLSIGTQTLERAPPTFSQKYQEPVLQYNPAYGSRALSATPGRGWLPLTSLKRPAVSLEFGIFRWRTDIRREVERIPVIKKQRAEFGFTEASCIFQHGLKYRPQLARPGADDPEHVGGSSLLLQRLV